MDLKPHNNWIARRRSVLLLLPLVLFASVSVFLAQKNTPRWIPRKATAGTEFVGDQSCAECHKTIAAAHSSSGMARALQTAADAPVLKANPLMKIRMGSYSYEIKRDNNQSIYSVTDGKETISVPILYSFGQGKAGQTYVLKHEGAFYETRVSFYREITGLDLTIGHQATNPGTLQEALGRRLSDSEAADCFSCHSTGGVGRRDVHLDKVVGGVRCEACHGPGAQHVAASRAGEPSDGPIFSGRLLRGDEISQDFCGACHQGSDQLSLTRMPDANTVRYQPFRIFHSKCYSDDRRIGCNSCHDPHQPLRRDAAYYDGQCLECHASKVKSPTSTVASSRAEQRACPVATKDCTSCHMPKLRVDGAHFSFTDHYIRIVKPKNQSQTGQ